MDTDTPLTDDRVFSHYDTQEWTLETKVVNAEFARWLERELSAAKRKIQQLETTVQVQQL